MLMASARFARASIAPRMAVLAAIMKSAAGMPRHRFDLASCDMLLPSFAIDMALPATMTIMVSAFAKPGGEDLNLF